MPGHGIFSFIIAVEDFDASQLPPDARHPKSEAFRTEVSKFLQREYEPFGGTTRIVVDQNKITVNWSPDDQTTDPLELALNRLRSGDYDMGVQMLRTLQRVSPRDVNVLFNLGMALSDQQRLDEAITILNQATSLAPAHANAWVGLGVAYARQRKPEKAAEVLRKALEIEPENPYAHRNLGACLLKLGRASEALEHLQTTTRLNPRDPQAWMGVAQASEVTGDTAAADKAYMKVIELDRGGQLGEMARAARSELAQQSFRSATPAGVRPDAIMYCLGALQQFSKMSHAEVQRVTFEIAMLGRGGLDVNDPTQKYTLRSLPGKFSGLHLVSIMYVGGKQVMPGQDLGFDLSKEYAAAQELFERGSTG